MGKLLFLLNIACVLFVYHSFWGSSSPIQWCLGCNQTFQFALCAPHHNHLDDPHLTKITHLLRLESIKCFGFKFGKEAWSPFSHPRWQPHLFFQNFYLLNLAHHANLSHESITSTIQCALSFCG